jgi:hypothetical protein
MRLAWSRTDHRMGIRYPGLSLSLLLLALLTGPYAGAQTSEALSPSIVLVLKLVSASHVKPVTGVVVSTEGLVLVPAEFVAEADAEAAPEIIVLDGGTDIARHGRPAELIHRSMAGGVAMLSVKGLQRPAIVLSESVFKADDEFHLQAFPPAAEIAKGAGPLRLPVAIEHDGPGQIAVSAETPLPWVTGAILDNCGYLAGLSLASGAQSLQTDRRTETIFAAELAQVLDGMQTSVPAVACVITQTKLAVPENTGSTENEVIGQAESAETSEHVSPDSESETQETSEPQTMPLPITNAEPSVKTRVTDSLERPSIWRSIPAWLIASTLAVLIIAAWKAIAFMRLHRNEPPGKTPGGDTRPQPASDEPPTAQLQTDSGTPSPVPRSGEPGDTGLPAVHELPAGCNALVVVEAQTDGNKRFEGHCAVNSDQFDVLIGRGAADISIEHPAISRSHARLVCERGVMTLSDCGSSNGTFIGAVPCLPGEIMYINPEDDVFLGDVCLEIDLINMGAG